MAERKSRRNVGLVTPDMLRKVASGDQVREVPPEDEASERAVLPPSRNSGAPKAGAGRIFAVPDSDDGGRSAEAFSSAVPDDPGRSGADVADLKFTEVLKRIGLEPAASPYQDHDLKMSNLEVLARRVWDEALSKNMGSHKARELIVDRLEGKAVRGDKPHQPDRTIEEQLERAEADLINSLSGKKG